MLTTTGSTTPSAATIRADSGGSDTGSQTFSSFSSPPTTNTYHHNYSVAGTYTPNASATPSGGSQITVPLSLDNAFDAGGATVGSEAAQPPGSTSSDDNSGKAMVVNPSDGSIFVASSFNATSTTSEFCVTKYNPDGTVATGWGNLNPTNGTSVFNFDSSKDVPSAIALGDANTCLMVAGNSTTDG